MEIIATLPPPYAELVGTVARHPLVDAARYNVGIKVRTSPFQTLLMLKRLMGTKTLFVDLKGRQLRIKSWARNSYAEIELNHEVEVNAGAEIFFRNGGRSTIRDVNRNKIYIESFPGDALGAGQAVNIHGDNLKIRGCLTKDDKAYIRAAKKLGIHDYMLSFVEEESDIEEVLALDSEARIVAKIESPKGLEFVRSIYPRHVGLVRLMAARDDLYENIGQDKTAMFGAVALILKSDPQAIVASRILESLEEAEEVSLADLSDLRLMEVIGFRCLLLGDDLCKDKKAFGKTMEVLAQYNNAIR